MNPTLDYKTPVPNARRLSVRSAAVPGIIAGAVTFSSIFLVGPLLYLGVGALTGILISAMAARASRGFEFRAGFLASGFAAASAFATRILCAPLLSGAGHPDSIASVFVVAFWWALFALLGMLGSLWFWEGRRPRERDEVPPAE